MDNPSYFFESRGGCIELLLSFRLHFPLQLLVFGVQCLDLETPSRNLCLTCLLSIQEVFHNIFMLSDMDKDESFLMLETETQTYQIDRWLQRLRAGDESAREQIIACAYERLMHLTHKMLGRYENVRRWEQTDDVMQNTAMRLHRTLDHARPDRAVDFFRLAAVAIRSELLDLARHHYGPLGEGAKPRYAAKAVRV